MGKKEKQEKENPVTGVSEKCRRKMVETGNHDHHHHHTPPTQAAPPPPPLGSARGPLYPPSEQLVQLHYCIHSNPSWGQYSFLNIYAADLLLFTSVACVFCVWFIWFPLLHDNRIFFQLTSTCVKLD